jgi:protocatechuate 3,4-dioxygenase beta subunit
MPTVVLCLIALLLPGVAHAQRDAQKTSSARLSGRVFAADTGRPLRRAVVRITFADAPVTLQRPGRSVVTDADGRWELSKIIAGRYEVTATRGGYVALGYGQRRPFGRKKVIQLADGEVLDRIDITLPRASAIAGRITDELGEPVTNAFVSAMRVRYEGGKRILAPLVEGLPAFLSGGITDDLGNYRIHGLAPGTYYVSAIFAGEGIQQAGDERLQVATYYPGTISSADAQTVVLSVGQDSQNVSFSLTPLRAGTVSGTILSSAGQAQRVFARLVPTGGVMLPFGEQSAPTSGDGTFTFTNVQPGDYIVLAHAATSAMPEPEIGMTPVSVSGGQDVTGLAVVTSPGAAVDGAIVLEGEKEGAIDANAFSIRAAGGIGGLTMPGASRVGVRADSTFSFRGLLGPHLLRLGHAPPGWQVKSVTIDGRDATDTPYDFKPRQKLANVEVVLARRDAQLAGSVQDERGSPSGDSTVVAFSVEPSRWGSDSRFVRTVTSNADGSFQIPGLVPDEYFVVALDSIEPGEETDRDRLESWRASASRVKLSDGDSKTVVVTLKSGQD